VEAEKRKRIRMPYHACVTVTSNGSRIIDDGELADISMKGVFIDTPVMLDENSSCEVKIRIKAENSSLTILANGKVARKTDYGIGIEFDQDLVWWPVFSMYKRKANEKCGE
jgi:hypothetical protein